MTNHIKSVDTQNVEGRDDAAESTLALAFEQDAALGYMTVNHHELLKNRNSDTWFLAIVIPIVVALGLVVFFFLFAFLSGMGMPHIC